MIKKIIFLTILLVSISCFIPNPIYGALLTVNPNGQVIPQVLGDSTIEIKKVALNTSTNQEISLNNTDGKIILNGTDVTNLNQDLIEIQARPNTNDLKISQSNGEFGIKENNITALTSFPITIDPLKNELSVTTNTGSRVITILPYEAILSLMRAKLIDNVQANKINLNENSNGELEYSISGEKKINLFNIASITTNVQSYVSATNGEILKIQQPVWLKLFGFLFT